MEYVIRDINNGAMLQHIELTRLDHNIQTHRCVYTCFTREALHLNYEEAQAVIQFISDVLDWEQAEQLEVAELKL